MAELATQVAGGKALPSDLLAQVVTRTEGVPLFVKDMTQMLLTALQTLPNTPAYARHELTLQIALGASLLVTEGYTAVAVEQAYARARTLCQQVGEVSQLSRVLFALWGVYMSRAEHRRARELGEQFLGLVQPLHNPIALLVAHHTLGGSLCFLGELALARHHLEHALALEAHQPQARSVEAIPLVTRVVNYAYTAWTLWLLGYPEQAQQRSHQALTLAHDLSHLYGQAVALFHAGKCHMFRRDGPAAQECAEAAIALATEHGFAFHTSSVASAIRKCITPSNFILAGVGHK